MTKKRKKTRRAYALARRLCAERAGFAYANSSQRMRGARRLRQQLSAFGAQRMRGARRLRQQQSAFSFRRSAYVRSAQAAPTAVSFQLSFLTTSNK